MRNDHKVVTKLKESNSHLLWGNCHAHIVHNTVKHVSDQLSALSSPEILQCLLHHCQKSLNEFCAFSDVEFHEILHHVVTRWLSLNPVSTTCFFISIGEVARQEFTAFLNTAVSYVENWFSFSEDNWLFHLQPLSLASREISYNDMETIIERLQLVGRLNTSMDELYGECVTAISILQRLTEQ